MHVYILGLQIYEITSSLGSVVANKFYSVIKIIEKHIYTCTHGMNLKPEVTPVYPTHDCNHDEESHPCCYDIAIEH